MTPRVSSLKESRTNIRNTYIECGIDCDVVVTHTGCAKMPDDAIMMMFRVTGNELMSSK